MSNQAKKNNLMAIIRYQHIVKLLRKILTLGICLCLVICSAIALTVPPIGAEPDNEYELVDYLIDENLFNDLSELVKIKTYRNADLSDEQVLTNLEEIRKDYLNAQVKKFNNGQRTHKLIPFEWKKTIEDREYWLFGLRLGTGTHKIAVITHLDTVPPGSNPNWEPFTLKKEQREYLGQADQEFYVARGAIDDKGPAVVAFNVLKAFAKNYDGNTKLNTDFTFELIFDTAEETDMATLPYLEDEDKDELDKNPDFGLIYDASWSIRAEKGIERPVFTINKRDTPVNNGMWIEELNTTEGPSNQIPDKATATIKSDSQEQLENFAKVVDVLYSKNLFDDPTEYRRANLTIDQSGMPEKLKLETKVAGAQHGSAPDENRKYGANPLVSLANFLGGLVDRGTLVSNEVGRMCQFISWAWGTKVFGEYHPELLERHDQVFTEGNGTTYALTRFYTNPQDGVAVKLEVDIRYAIGHHSQPWYGKEGFLPGDKSIFEDVFSQLLAQFNNGSRYQVEFETSTVDPPDIRLTDGENFSKISTAYQQVTGKPSPAFAIGGGTDAKGNTQLIAGGALFTKSMGPPINYHGFNEGAPVNDLKIGARIIYRLFVNEIEAADK